MTMQKIQKPCQFKLTSPMWGHRDINASPQWRWRHAAPAYKCLLSASRDSLTNCSRIIQTLFCDRESQTRQEIWEGRLELRGSVDTYNSVFIFNMSSTHWWNGREGRQDWSDFDSMLKLLVSCIVDFWLLTNNHICSMQWEYYPRSLK